MAADDLNELVEEALWHALDKSQSPPSQADTIAAALLANPDVVLRALGAIHAKTDHQGKDTLAWFAPNIPLRHQIQMTNESYPGLFPLYWFPKDEG